MLYSDYRSARNIVLKPFEVWQWTVLQKNPRVSAGPDHSYSTKITRTLILIILAFCRVL